ncbi:hypothetical protein [Geopseudomonas aromaticivorans]
MAGKTSALWLALLLGTTLLAQAAPPARPLGKDGLCPNRYYTRGHFCVPDEKALVAIPKRGRCPDGYHASGNYCQANSRLSKTAFPMFFGECPMEFYESGNYCLSYD